MQCRGIGSNPGLGRPQKPVCHSPCSCAPEPGNHNYRSPNALEPVLCNKTRHRKEKPEPRHQRVTLLSATREKLGQQGRPRTVGGGAECELFTGRTFTEVSRKHSREEHGIASVGQIREGIKQNQMQEKFTYTLINK